MLATFYYVSPTVGANFALIAYVTVALAVSAACPARWWPGC